MWGLAALFCLLGVYGAQCAVVCCKVFHCCRVWCRAKGKKAQRTANPRASKEERSKFDLDSIDRHSRWPLRYMGLNGTAFFDGAMEVANPPTGLGLGLCAGLGFVYVCMCWLLCQASEGEGQEGRAAELRQNVLLQNGLLFVSGPTNRPNPITIPRRTTSI